eukprot:gene4409-14576_t
MFVLCVLGRFGGCVHEGLVSDMKNLSRLRLADPETSDTGAAALRDRIPAYLPMTEFIHTGESLARGHWVLGTSLAGGHYLYNDTETGLLRAPLASEPAHQSKLYAVLYKHPNAPEAPHRPRPIMNPHPGGPGHSDPPGPNRCAFNVVLVAIAGTWHVLGLQLRRHGPVSRSLAAVMECMFAPALGHTAVGNMPGEAGVLRRFTSLFFSMRPRLPDGEQLAVSEVWGWLFDALREEHYQWRNVAFYRGLSHQAGDAVAGPAASSTSVSDRPSGHTDTATEDRRWRTGQGGQGGQGGQDMGRSTGDTAQEGVSRQHVDPAIAAADVLALHTQLPPHVVRVLLRPPFSWKPDDLRAQWGGCREGPTADSPREPALCVTNGEARALDNLPIAVTHTHAHCTALLVLPVATGWAHFTVQGAHPRSGEVRSVAQHCAQDHGLQVDPAGPVVLAKEGSHGRFVLLPADLCTRATPTSTGTETGDGDAHMADSAAAHRSEGPAPSRGALGAALLGPLAASSQQEGTEPRTGGLPEEDVDPSANAADGREEDRQNEAGTEDQGKDAGECELIHAAQAAEWPAIADLIDALTTAAEYMTKEGTVVSARPGRDRPLHAFG